MDGPPRDQKSGLKHVMAAIVGSDHVDDDGAACALHGEDIWAPGAGTIALVVAPASTEQLSKVIRAAHAAGLSVAPRGAGASYTAGYVPVHVGTLSIDMRRMNRVVAVDAGDMVVTVEAGCTWAALYEALRAQGLRTPFWGPMSGLASTVGGGLSQLNAMLGAGHYGTSSAMPRAGLCSKRSRSNWIRSQASTRAYSDWTCRFYRPSGKNPTLVPKAEEDVFFSEEKKQKTFMSLSRFYPAACIQETKVFWFFFFKKELLS